MKRRLISVITVLAICLTLVVPSTSVFAETELPYWDKAVTIEGRTLTLTITSKNASGSLCGGTMELGYDPELLEYVEGSASGLAVESGIVNGLSKNNSFIANFALAKSSDSDATLVTAHFNIAEDKVCPSNPFTVIRDKLVCLSGATATPKQANIDSEDNVITPAISFTCSHTIEGDWEITKQPSATENGERVKKCAVCQQVIKTETMEKLGDAIYWKKTVTVEGTKVKLVIESVNGAGKLAGGNVTLTYDSDALTFNPEGSSTKIGANFGSMGIINPNKAGRYTVNFAGLYPIENDGVIATAMFDIAEGKFCTADTFKLEKEMFSSEDPTNIELNSSTEPIEFTCKHTNTHDDIVPATCKADGSKTTVCNSCGATISTTTIPKGEHNFTEKVEEVPATCTEGGKIVWKCSACDETKTENIKPLGHNEGEGVVTTEPTCEKAGVKTFKCTRCDEVLRTEPIAALGHDWDEGKITTEPSCEGGVKVFTCSRCQKTKTEKVPAAGHVSDKGTVVTEPTCTEPGVLVTKCEVCHKELSRVEIPATGHSWNDGVVIKGATATEKGIKEFTCKRCDASKTEEIDYVKPFDPTKVYWKKTVTVEGRKVKLVIESVNAAGKLAGGNVTMTYDSNVLTFNSEGSSTKIGANFGSLGSINPNKAGRYIVNFAGMYPIENDGVIAVAMFDIAEGKVCNADTFKLEKEEFASDDPANVKIDWTTGPIEFTCLHKDTAESITTPATCENAGVKTITCSDCGNVSETTINKLGHDWDNGKITTEPTAEVKGVKTFTCKRCKATKTEDVAYTRPFDPTTVYWKKTVTVEGRKVKLVIESVNAAGKLAGGNVTMTYDSDALTFNSEGSSTRIGANFGSLGSINPNKAGRYIVNFVGLYPIEKDGVIAVAMFDIAEGKFCTADTFKLEKEEFVSDDPQNIQIDWTTGPIEFTCLHKDTAESIITPATCENTGVKTVTCSDCGNTTPVTIDALGHSFTNYVSDGNATCTVDGTKTAKCDRCDATDTVADTGSALGHDYKVVSTIPATCDKDGKTVYECSHDSSHTYEEKIEKLGHNEGEGKVTTEPSCEKEGVRTFRCTRCEKVLRTEPIAALGHTPGEKTVEVEPTLTTEGVSRVRCTVCKKILEETIIPKLLKYGDVDTNGTVNIMDAVMLLRYNAELESLTSAQKLAADVDGNGKVGIEDTLLILRYNAELIVSFPAETKK